MGIIKPKYWGGDDDFKTEKGEKSKESDMRQRVKSSHSFIGLRNKKKQRAYP